MEIHDTIKAKAMSLGFSICGITTPDPVTGYGRFLKWIDDGFHAGMRWLETPSHRSKRADPHLLDPDVRSIIVLGLPYPIRESLPNPQSEQGWISGYAHGDDYHTSIPILLNPLLANLKAELGEDLVAHVYTDSAPILERELGARAGLGWIGKNSCLVSPEIGSNFFLTEIFVNKELPHDAPFNQDLCGTCTRCMDACPTACIRPDRTIDAGKCLSYQTIENRGVIPAEINEKLGNWIFGCDICQMVCPWNKNQVPQISDLELNLHQMTSILELDEAGFKNRFHNSAILRAKRLGFFRNLIIWLYLNQGSVFKSLVPELVRSHSLLRDTYSLLAKSNQK